MIIIFLYSNLHSFFDLTYFREVGQKHRNIFVRFVPKVILKLTDLYQYPFCYRKFVVHVSIIKPIFLQKTRPLHPNHLGLGFEFGPQRIRDLAFVRP